MPSVAYYVMGEQTAEGAPRPENWNRWAISDKWPLPVNNINYYFQASNTLSTNIPSESKKFTYKFDPSKPIQTKGGNNLNESNRGPMDQRDVETGRTDIVKFDLDVVESPLSVIGRVSANLFVTSDRLDTDFTAKLVDVYPDGREILICDGIVRMRHRNGMDKEELMDVSDATIYEAMIDLWSTAYVFNTGHKLRVVISSSNYPRFDVNPNTGERIKGIMTPNDPYLIANNSILVAPDYPSSIILPTPINPLEFYNAG